MTDVRLTATTPGGDVVPVLANTKGELLLEAPPAPPEFDGNLNGDLVVSGSADFAGKTTVGLPDAQTVNLRPAMSGTGDTIWLENANGDRPFLIGASGSAVFGGDVVIGSRGKKWLIRESNGVAMLIEQTRSGMADTDQIEKVRDLPRELDLIEAALNEVMEKLRMTPPAGWEVWDGSDNSR